MILLLASFQQGHGRDKYLSGAKEEEKEGGMKP
jgi:hypothetical protein